MPGTDDRLPSDADRAPASRVGQKLQEHLDEISDAELSDEEAAEIDERAIAEAEDEGWDQRQTARE